MSDEKLNHTLERIANLLTGLQTHQSPATPHDQKHYDAYAHQSSIAPQYDESEFIGQLQNFGPLQPLLEDDSINDILINGPKDIYIERSGKLTRADVSFPDDASVYKLAEQIAETVGRKLDRRRPLVDARLLDGSRVNIVAPPLAVDHTLISIRKFAKSKITLEKMTEQGNMSPALATILHVCAGSRLNILISGGTGAGKTTLLNAMSDGIDDAERIVTIEDSAELKLSQPHVARLETKPLDLSRGRDEEVSTRDLVRNALRMRPDRIIVGEVRGPEAFDMLQAMNTGHEGSMTTVHANHPRDCLARLENMVMTANLGLPSIAIRQQIASAVNLIVQISRMRDGRRRITQVSEVVGMEGDVITMQDLFTFVPDGKTDANGALSGRFKWSGIVPRFIRRVAYWGHQDTVAKALGIDLPRI
jgi:pilus assembly protein CpaF